MKTNALLLLCLLGFFSTLKAGTWTVQPWTGDASTGIVNGETQWAYHFGSATSATVNGVSVPGFATLPVTVANQFDLTGSQFVLAFDPNNLTNLGGSSSAVLGSSFFFWWRAFHESDSEGGLAPVRAEVCGVSAERRLGWSG